MDSDLKVFVDLEFDHTILYDLMKIWRIETTQDCKIIWGRGKFEVALHLAFSLDGVTGISRYQENP